MPLPVLHCRIYVLPTHSSPTVYSSHCVAGWFSSMIDWSVQLMDVLVLPLHYICITLSYVVCYRLVPDVTHIPHGWRLHLRRSHRLFYILPVVTVCHLLIPVVWSSDYYGVLHLFARTRMDDLCIVVTLPRGLVGVCTVWTRMDRMDHYLRLDLPCYLTHLLLHTVGAYPHYLHFILIHLPHFTLPCPITVICLLIATFA